MDSAENEKDTKEKKSRTVVKTVDVYNFSTECWSTPKALELPKVLRSPQVVVFQEYVYLTVKRDLARLPLRGLCTYVQETSTVVV